MIVTKISVRRGEGGSWIPPFSGEELTAAVHDNLRTLGLDVLDVVNPGSMFSIHEPAEGSIEAPLTVLSELPQKGLVRHIGLSNAARADRRSPTDRSDRLRAEPLPLAHRTDDALIADLARDGIAYVPFFPLGGFTPLQSTTLSGVTARLGATPMQVALA